MKKSITILSVFLLLTFCSFHYERGGLTLSKMEIRSVFPQKQYSPFSISAGFSYLDGENDPDPPRQDPWQWRNAFEKLMELLKYFLSSK